MQQEKKTQQSQPTQQSQQTGGEERVVKDEKVANPAQLSAQKEEMQEVVSSVTHISSEQTSVVQQSISMSSDQQV